ncbi:hypothetical protein CRUP_007605, partial [Coryphaenoides rupestris]
MQQAAFTRGLIEESGGNWAKVSTSYATADRAHRHTLDAITEEQHEQWTPPPMCTLHWDSKLTPMLTNVHHIGTAGLAVQVVGSNWPKPHYTLLITGLCRFRVSALLKERPFVLAEVEQLDKLEQYPPSISQEGLGGGDGELGALSQEFYQTALQTLPDVVASMIRTSNKEKLQVLDAVGLEERFRRALPLLTRQIEGLRLLQKSRKPRPDDEKR